MNDNKLIFTAKRSDTNDFVTGFFTKKKIGTLIVPVIEVYKESDFGDYMQSYEIDGSTLKSFPLSNNVKKDLRQIYKRYDGSHYIKMLDSIEEYILTNFQ